MDRNRQAVMEKARAKRQRRSERKAGHHHPEATGLAQSVKELAHSASATISNLVTSTAHTITQAVGMTSESQVAVGS